MSGRVVPPFFFDQNFRLAYPGASAAFRYGITGDVLRHRRYSKFVMLTGYLPASNKNKNQAFQGCVKMIDTYFAIEKTCQQREYGRVDNTQK